MGKETEVISRWRGGLLDHIVSGLTRGRFGVETQVVRFRGFKDLLTGKTVSDPLKSGLDTETGARDQIGLVMPEQIVRRRIVRI